MELRHIVGLLFDDDRKPVPLEQELRIIDDVVAKVRKQENLKEFHLKLIICGLKIIGRPHVVQSIQSLIEGRNYSNLLAGFDMVNQENVTPPLLSFVPDILEGKRKDSKGQCLPCFFHCGETHDRDNQNIFDAVLLGTKRLGHGFQLFLHPHLQSVVKQKDICIEACPISNLLLGYTQDLRNHPVRYMLAKGLQASISSDDPGFFGYEGVTMDYLAAYVAWELSLRDLKKLSLNGIKYSTVDEATKAKLTNEVFPEHWNAFIRDVITTQQ